MGGVSTRQQMQNAGAAWLHMDRPTKLMFDPLPGGRAGRGRPFGTSLRNVLPLVPGSGASLAKPRVLARGEGVRV